jgi:cytochrome c biogenesis protein CcdA
MICPLKRLTLIVLSIGLADSLNPTTVGPALYLATTRHARRQVAEFAVGIFAVNLIGGALIALGPGQLLLALVPHPSSFAKHLTEVVVGAAILIAAAILWSRRSQFAARALPSTGGRTGAGAVLGAGIALVELPTAFPYFAAIAAIVASGASPGGQIALLVLFNVAFIAPLLAIVVVVLALGDRAERVLRPASEWVRREWPVVVSTLGAVIGIAVLLVGAVGLAGD